MENSANPIFLSMYDINQDKLLNEEFMYITQSRYITPKACPVLQKHHILAFYGDTITIILFCNGKLNCNQKLTIIGDGVHTSLHTQLKSQWMLDFISYVNIYLQFKVPLWTKLESWCRRTKFKFGFDFVRLDTLGDGVNFSLFLSLKIWRTSETKNNYIAKCQMNLVPI